MGLCVHEIKRLESKDCLCHQINVETYSRLISQDELCVVSCLGLLRSWGYLFIVNSLMLFCYGPLNMSLGFACSPTATVPVIYNFALGI